MSSTNNNADRYAALAKEVARIEKTITEYNRFIAYLRGDPDGIIEPSEMMEPTVRFRNRNSGKEVVITLSELGSKAYESFITYFTNEIARMIVEQEANKTEMATLL